MIELLLAAAAVQGAVASSSVNEAAHALAAGRVEQARAMIATAVGRGEKGAEIDRLLADLALASGDNARALAGYSALLERNASEPILAELAGLAALRLNKVEQAVMLLERAVASPEASWRAWNLRGVAADRMHDWATADDAYLHAAELAPGRADVLNNHGWSQMLRGHWVEAITLLDQAAASDPKNALIARNRELASFAAAGGLPQRQTGESAREFAARLNDAGVMAALTGDRSRAVAAFSQAIDARSEWFDRAANNLNSLRR